MYFYSFRISGKTMSRPASRNTAIPDEYPARPTSLLRHEIQTMNSKIEKNETRSLIILCVTYFIFGCGLGLYGPLYPREVNKQNWNLLFELFTVK